MAAGDGVDIKHYPAHAVRHHRSENSIWSKFWSNRQTSAGFAPEHPSGLHMHPRPRWSASGGGAPAARSGSAPAGARGNDENFQVGSNTTVVKARRKSDKPGLPAAGSARRKSGALVDLTNAVNTGGPSGTPRFILFRAEGVSGQ